MFDISDFIVQETETVYNAAKILYACKRNIIFVCSGLKLLASFTDGDFRRYILRSGDLTKSVSEASNYDVVKFNEKEKHIIPSFISKNPNIRGIPIIDDNGNIVSIEFTNNAVAQKRAKLNIPVVIMAGGKGTRLAPYTDVLPKPLIPVGDMTITEHIVKRFNNFGCSHFTMIVYHKKGLIKAYFKENPCKAELNFVDEINFQGTGGGLKLLDGKFKNTFFMTNCDILIDADYGSILKHHKQTEAIITIVCALKKISVPYGTVELDKNGVPIKLVEKPEYPLLTNTGLYVIEPSFLETIPTDEFIHITDLIQNLINKGKTVSVYPINEESWLDMGQPDELQKMQDALNFIGG